MFMKFSYKTRVFSTRFGRVQYLGALTAFLASYCLFRMLRASPEIADINLRVFVRFILSARPPHWSIPLLRTWLHTGSNLLGGTNK